MRKLDVATIGPPEYCKFCGKLLKPKPLAIAIIFTRNHSFLGGAFALALVSSCCLRVAQAMPCPAEDLGVRAGAMGMDGPPFARRRILPALSQLTYIYKDEINENGCPRLERCWQEQPRAFLAQDPQGEVR